MGLLHMKWDLQEVSSKQWEARWNFIFIAKNAPKSLYLSNLISFCFPICF